MARNPVVSAMAMYSQRLGSVSKEVTAVMMTSHVYKLFKKVSVGGLSHACHTSQTSQLLARDKDLQGAPVQVRTSRYISFVTHVIPSQ